jgi:hypothetical protein
MMRYSARANPCESDDKASSCGRSWRSARRANWRPINRRPSRRSSPSSRRSGRCRFSRSRFACSARAAADYSSGLATAWMIRCRLRVRAARNSRGPAGRASAVACCRVAGEHPTPARMPDSNCRAINRGYHRPQGAPRALNADGPPLCGLGNPSAWRADLGPRSPRLSCPPGVLNDLATAAVEIERPC